MNVAAFVTPKLLESLLADKAGQYDLVLISGLCGSDFSKLEAKLGIKIRLGPKHAFDIPLALRYADKLEFSHKISADQLLTDVKRDSALKEFEAIEREAHPAFTLKGVKIGGGASMKVMAEVVDATPLSDMDLVRKIESYAAADIIDLGVPLEASPEAVSHAVRVAKSVTAKPVSVDTLIPEYVEAGINAGADLVLSLDSSNVGTVGPLAAKKGVAVVVIPDDETLDSLIRNVEAAKASGVKNIIADPVLSPAGHGLVNAVCRYRKFREWYPEMPVFFGAGNVSELIDADSIGVNALLAAIAMEAGASVLFTTEASQKTLGSADELKKACMMMALAQRHHESPKDLGVDLLRDQGKAAAEGRGRAIGPRDRGKEAPVQARPPGQLQHFHRGRQDIRTQRRRDHRGHGLGVDPPHDHRPRAGVDAGPRGISAGGIEKGRAGDQVPPDVPAGR